jgi:hypothetical protein
MKTTTKRITAGAVSVALVLFTSLSTATADELIEPSPIAKVAKGLNPVNWKMPQWKVPGLKQLLPGGEEKARIKNKKEGLVYEVSKTASNSWNKTKQAFSPKNLNPIRFFSASAKKPSQQKQESKPGFFRSLFTPKPKVENNSDTVTDFLRQKRPGL